MITAQQALVQAARRLNAAGLNGALDARVLLAHVLGVDRGRLTLVLSDEIHADQADAFDRAIEARLKRQPVAQIIGRRLFYGREFIVTSNVLDPRPETEELVAAALVQPFKSVLDLGTGSGCILLTLLAERVDARGVGGDISDAALSVARDNADQLGLSPRTEFVTSNWFNGISGRYDLIVSNPPYIADDEMTDLSQDVLDWEPHLALTPGGDGLAPYRTLAAGASQYLSSSGRLLVEIGPKQGAVVADMFRNHGFYKVEILKDMDGRDRVVCGQYS